MGHSSKFQFSLPGRKQKAPPPPPITPVPPPNGVPLTKAQRILGTGPINLDSNGSSSNSKWAWEGQSSTGTAMNGRDNGASRLGSGHQDDRRLGSGHRERRWEEESEVLPKPGMTGTMGHDDTTDASSLRRRQSSSTIRSYYDKAKVPLSISQQTANSAMAKGLPSNSKAHALLDIEGNFDTQRLAKKKKPSRLDLSSLIPRHKSSKTHLRPEPERNHVLSPDMLTKSPSLMSLSPAPTPPPIAQRIERKLRNKMTKESLRSISSVPDSIVSPAVSTNRSEPTKQPPIKANPQLHNLYDNYEQKTFDEAMEHDLHTSQGRPPPPDRPLPAYPTPPTSNTGKPSLSPFPRSTSRTGHHNPPPLTVTVPEVQLSGPPSAPSLVSPTADCASISSRHTRTSKASKRTDRSLTEIDLLQNSVLALSSDSEEDDYEASNDQLSVPPPSEGPASPVSPRSALSQPYSKSDDHGRNKPPKQTTFAENPEFFPAKVEPKPTATSKTRTRSSSLTAGSKQSQVYPPNSRLSNGTTSTVQTLGYSALLTPTACEAKAINMVPKSKLQNQTFRPVPEETQFEDFPAPPIHGAPRPGPTSHPSEQTPPLSPTSVDFYLQSQRTSIGNDSGSVRSGASHGSGGQNARRSSATSSINDGSSGRFMAVTRQEEMLLAALRQKRARMREDILAEYEESERADSALSNSRPRGNSVRTSQPPAEKGSHGRILVMMDEADSDVTGLVQLDDFPAPAERDNRRGTRSASRRSPRAALSCRSTSSRKTFLPPPPAARAVGDQLSRSVNSTPMFVSDLLSPT
ncbi:hypothetical protein QBC35DRAFT_516691 [Podospora australis]|uniref:Uncharacterized protein n=1 Tax=Podospora australis TaxID=1536484 RepID=A0AAN6WT10_9PEZI|nr:hypothetical protein QBC35DRAFT_516691 [Podospora australis]